MHRLINPPPVAPPIVAPPLPNEAAIPAEADSNSAAADQPQSSAASRIVRDLKIGGACLLTGWLIAQTSLVDQLSQGTIFAGRISLAHNEDIVATPASIIIARPSQLIDLPLATLDPLPAAESLSPADRLDLSPSTDSESASESSQSNLGLAVNGDSAESDDIAAVASEADEHQGIAATAASEWADHLGLLAKQTPPPIAELPEIDLPISLAAPATVPAADRAPCADGTCPTGKEGLESLGTVLAWAESPADAYQMAVEQQKLVFMIHVSGNFEIPGFT